MEPRESGYLSGPWLAPLVVLVVSYWPYESLIFRDFNPVIRLALPYAHFLFSLAVSLFRHPVRSTRITRAYTLDNFIHSTNQSRFIVSTSVRKGRIFHGPRHDRDIYVHRFFATKTHPQGSKWTETKPLSINPRTKPRCKLPSRKTMHWFL